jgi:hypothetical protein
MSTTASTTRNSRTSSQKPRATSGNVSRKTSQLKNVSLTSSQPGLVTISRASAPRTMTTAGRDGTATAAAPTVGNPTAAAGPPLSADQEEAIAVSLNKKDAQAVGFTLALTKGASKEAIGQAPLALMAVEAATCRVTPRRVTIRRVGRTRVRVRTAVVRGLAGVRARATLHHTGRRQRRDPGQEHRGHPAAKGGRPAPADRLRAGPRRQGRAGRGPLPLRSRLSRSACASCPGRRSATSGGRTRPARRRGRGRPTPPSRRPRPGPARRSGTAG